MVSTPLRIKDKFEYLDLSAQTNFSDDFPVNSALIHVAQAVMEILRHTYPVEIVDDNNNDHNNSQTIAIRAIAPECRQLITAKSLTARELEVLQLIVEGDKNLIIARKLYITEDTVKTHVRSVLRKLCVEDRTQAAILALRSGLIH